MSNQPIRGQQYVFYLTLVSRATGQFQSNPTIATGDFQISKDGTAYTNLGTLPAVEPAGSESVKVTLSATEMSASNVNFRGKDQAGAEWDDVFSNIQPLSWLTPSDYANVNVVQWASGTVVAPNLTGIPKVDLIDIDGLATNGYNATLKLKQLDILNDAGDAFKAISSGGGGNGITVNGFEGHGIQTSGLANGIHAYSNSAGNGIVAYGAGASGHGIDAQGDGGVSINAPGNIFGNIIGNITGSMVGNIYGYVGMVTGSVLRVLEPIGISTGTFINAIADQVWDEAIAGHLGVGSTGEKLNSAGAAGDPWSTALPGSYISGQAGYILASRMPTGTVLVGDKTGFSLSSPQSFDLIGNISGSISSVVGLNTAYIDTYISSRMASGTVFVSDKTGFSLSSPQVFDLIGNITGTFSGYTTPPTAIENADALLKRDWNSVTGEAARSVLNALRKLRNKVSFNGTNTLTMTKEDDTTTAYTQSVVEDPNQDPFKEVG